jgi:hypothetical protein
MNAPGDARARAAELGTFIKAFHARDAFADAVMTLRNSGISLGIACHHDVPEREAAMWAASQAVWDLREAQIIAARGEAGDLQARLSEALRSLASAPPEDSRLLNAARRVLDDLFGPGELGTREEMRRDNLSFQTLLELRDAIAEAAARGAPTP